MYLMKLQGDESGGLLRRSRVVKAAADQDLVGSFSEGELRLRAACIRIVVADDCANTVAGQAAVLTAARVCLKIFEHVAVEGALDQPFILPILGAGSRTLRAALLELGARHETTLQAINHDIIVGAHEARAPVAVRCWWDGWLTGIRPYHDATATGQSTNPLAGVFAGAMAVREIFARHMLNNSRATRRTSILSLWEPWGNGLVQGPDAASFPNKPWLIGLGHLGQGIAWNLLLLPWRSKRHILLQDDQSIGVENEPTGLLVLEDDIDGKKCRSVARWFERAGWTTSLIERRHYGDAPRDSEPPLVFTALDRPQARRLIAAAGFPYMVDTGVGRGPVDFETIQLHCLARDDDLSGLWTHAVAADRSRMMAKSAYQEQDDRIGGCGIEEIAGAGVAVPFVGAATGAIAMAQSARIFSLAHRCKSFQLQMACPEMASFGDMASSAGVGLGGERLRINALPERAQQ